MFPNTIVFPDVPLGTVSHAALNVSSRMPDLGALEAQNAAPPACNLAMPLMLAHCGLISDSIERSSSLSAQQLLSRFDILRTYKMLSRDQLVLMSWFGDTNSHDRLQ